MMLYSEMERIGRILAADTGLEVRIAGSLAAAGPGYIQLPAIDDPTLTIDRRMMHGFLDHEVGHALYTDFDTVELCKDRRTFMIMNALEDGVIESRVVRRWPGAKHNLHYKNMRMWEVGIRGEPTSAAVKRLKPFEAFCTGLTMLVREHSLVTLDDVCALRSDLSDPLAACEEEIAQLIALREADSHKTADVLQLAEKIAAKVAALESEHRDEERAEDQESADMPGAPAPAPHGGDAEADDAEADDAEADDAEADDAEAEDAEAEREPVNVMVLGRSIETTDPTTEAEIAYAVSIPHYPDMTPSRRRYEVYSHRWDVEIDVYERWQALQKQPEDEARLIADVAATAEQHVFPLMSAFESALLADRETHLSCGASEGEVDTTVLGEYAVGSMPADEIFFQDTRVDAHDTAVALLVDCSGSMHGRPASVAREAAYAMATALDRVQIPHEVTGFTTASEEYAPDWIKDMGLREKFLHGQKEIMNEKRACELRGENMALFDRPWSRYYRALVPVHIVFKPYGQTDLNGLALIEGIGENLDGEALLWQARRLQNTTQKRRIMFVLSDGAPAGTDDRWALTEHTKQAVRRIESAGIEVYGIGICSMHVRDLFRDWWLVQDLGELASVAMTALASALLSGRRSSEEWDTNSSLG